MDEQLTAKNNNYDLNHHNQEDDYKNLINRLKEMSLNIALLEKKYLDKV